MDQEAVEAELKRRFPNDGLEENSGCNSVLGRKIWELWVVDERGNVATRFLEEEGETIIRSYNASEQLFDSMNNQFNELRDKLRDAELRHNIEIRQLEMHAAGDVADRSLKKMITIIAGGAFLVSLGAFLYLLAKGDLNAFWPAIIMLASTLATCATFLYGRFVLIKPSELTPPK